jgi:hypothetical protein
MTASSWTVFFMLKPLTTVHTTILTDNDGVEDTVLISIAKAKIQTELGIDIDLVAKRLGVNDNYGGGWIMVEQNDFEATEKELELLPVNKTK